MTKKALKTGALYGNASDYFERGKSPSLDTDKQNYAGHLKDGYSYVAHQDSPDPVAFTQSRVARKGGGFDYGEKKYIYKKVDTPEPVTPAASTPEPEVSASEPAKERTAIEHSDEVKQAKERVGNFKAGLNGAQGSDFSTDDSTEAKAQGLADKYKLNLMEQAVPGS